MLLNCNIAIKGKHNKLACIPVTVFWIVWWPTYFWCERCAVYSSALWENCGMRETYSIVTIGSPMLQKWWTLFFNEFISLALTSTFTLDEPELYNPLAGFRGQQQRGPEGRENHSHPGKNSDIQFSTWFISAKLKLIVCHYWAGSCLGEMYQSLLILI